MNINKAEELIYDTFLKIQLKIKNYCLYKLHDKQNIDDCLQQIIINAITKADQLCEKENIEYWLLKHSNSVVKNFNRKYLNDKNNLMIIEDEQEFVDIHNEIEGNIIAKEIYNYIYKNLDEIEQMMFRYHIEQELTIKEISEKLNLKYKTISSRINRLTKKIAIIYDEYNKNK